MKKVMIYVFTVLSLLLILSSIVAAEESMVDRVFNTLKESKALKFITVDLVKGLRGPTPSSEAITITKILFTILAFAVLYGISSFVPFLKEQRNVRMVVTLLFAIVAGIGMPADWIVYIVKLYGGFAVLAIVAIPVILISIANFTWAGEGRLVYLAKAFLMALVVFPLGFASEVAKDLGMDLLETVLDFAWFIAGFLAFYYLVVGVLFDKGKDVAERGSSYVPDWAARPLRRLGRRMYQADRLSEREEDKLTDILNRLRAVNVSQNAVDQVRANHATVRLMVKELQEVQDEIKNRAQNLAVDTYTWANKVGDRELVEETEGMEAITVELGSVLERLFGNVRKLSATLYQPLAATPPQMLSNQGRTKAVDLHHKAIADLQSALSKITNLRALQRKVLKAAGKKKIQV